MNDSDQQTSLSQTPYRVAVLTEPDDWTELRAVLMSTLGLNSIDAQVHARKAPGLLPDTLNAEATKTRQ